MDNVLDFDMNFEQAQQSEADKKLLVMFFKGTVKNEIKSIEAGRPIFDEIDLVKIIAPGSRDSFVGDATYDYQQRFPQHWARYKTNQSQEEVGTPLNMLPWLTVAQVEEFRALSVKTVEQLAGMPDSVAQKFMGFHAIRQKAQSYLEAAKDSAPIHKMQAELQKRDDEIAQLKITVASLVKQNEAEQAAKKTPGVAGKA
jgi:hypothetical protein